jgi:hypothetical protein
LVEGFFKECLGTLSYYESETSKWTPTGKPFVGAKRVNSTSASQRLLHVTLHRLVQDCLNKVPDQLAQLERADRADSHRMRRTYAEVKESLCEEAKSLLARVNACDGGPSSKAELGAVSESVEKMCNRFTRQINQALDLLRLSVENSGASTGSNGV